MASDPQFELTPLGAAALSLPPLAAEVLAELASRGADQICSHDELIAALWPKVRDRENLRVHICKARKAARRVGADIKGVYGRGYRFVALPAGG